MKVSMEQSLIVRNIGELVTYNSTSESMQVLHNVEMLVSDGYIQEIGKDLYSPEFRVVDAGNVLITSGFVDPHTHPVFYGTRELEYEMRIMGKSYMEIAAAGGGIRSSVRSLRSADYNILKMKVRQRLDDFLQFGTTTIEAKSGYGLSPESELMSLQLLKDLADEHPLDIVRTFLGAHEYPDEYRDNPEGYIDLIIQQMLPKVAREKLADFCDVFCEEGVFSVRETRMVLEAAKFLGLGIRLHTEEFKPIGGVQLAAKLGAISADHLTAITEEGIEALIEGNIIPILLPATTFFLGSDHYAPGRKMWDKGLPVAIATDFNPGSSMTQSMPLVISIACLKLKLTPLEAIQAATYNAARSLVLEDRVGSLEKGKQADFVLWKFEKYQGIPYFLGYPSVQSVWKNGVLVWGSD
ncbi:imidazolonepropionase [bacterium]|nr:imidazolonepropionase [bacterium]MBU1065011.1 imidazolonepropionase [bacterium]MBU1634965.1 imidazolonepropionase [bacterium]MBU1872779.1 imidazolonepropionase [bacterium]